MFRVNVKCELRTSRTHQKIWTIQDDSTSSVLSMVAVMLLNQTMFQVRKRAIQVSPFAGGFAIHAPGSLSPETIWALGVIQGEHYGCLNVRVDRCLPGVLTSSTYEVLLVRAYSCMRTAGLSINVKYDLPRDLEGEFLAPLIQAYSYSTSPNVWPSNELPYFGTPMHWKPRLKRTEPQLGILIVKIFRKISPSK